MVLIQQQIAAGVPNAQQQFQQNLQAAQSQMNELKNKINRNSEVAVVTQRCPKDLNLIIKKQKVFSKD